MKILIFEKMKNPLYKVDNSPKYICTKVNKQNNKLSNESVVEYNYHTKRILTKHSWVFKVKHNFNRQKK